MDFSNKTEKELINLVQSSDDKETLRAVADQVGVSYSGNSGVSKLKENILSEISVNKESEQETKDENLSAPDPVLMAALNKNIKEKKSTLSQKNTNKLPDLATLINMDERESNISEPLRRAIVRAKALRLIRCRITNLDPQDSAVPGAIITVYNKYTGKVSKLIPFGDENEHGYHVPKILIDELKSRTFNMRKEKKRIGSSFGVREYSTVQVRKFSIEELPPLTQEELDNLANDQKARGAISQEE